MVLEHGMLQYPAGSQAVLPLLIVGCRVRCRTTRAHHFETLLTSAYGSDVVSRVAGALSEHDMVEFYLYLAGTESYQQCEHDGRGGARGAVDCTPRFVRGREGFVTCGFLPRINTPWLKVSPRCGSHRYPTTTGDAGASLLAAVSSLGPEHLGCILRARIAGSYRRSMEWAFPAFLMVGAVDQMRG
jgi:hypothetical protein